MDFTETQSPPYTIPSGGTNVSQKTPDCSMCMCHSSSSPLGFAREAIQILLVHGREEIIELVVVLQLFLVLQPFQLLPTVRCRFFANVGNLLHVMKPIPRPQLMNFLWVWGFSLLCWLLLTQ